MSQDILVLLNTIQDKISDKVEKDLREQHARLNQEEIENIVAYHTEKLAHRLVYNYFKEEAERKINRIGKRRNKND